MFPSVLLVRPNSRVFFGFVSGGANCFFLCFTFLMGYTGYVGKRREERKQEGKKEGGTR